MENAADIVREEWHRAVKEFGLRPGSHVETVVARILNRVVHLPVGNTSRLCNTIRDFSSVRTSGWSVADLKRHLNNEWPPKQVYNAIGYLTRKGKLSRDGYGRYQG